MLEPERYPGLPRQWFSHSTWLGTLIVKQIAQEVRTKGPQMTVSVSVGFLGLQAEDLVSQEWRPPNTGTRVTSHSKEPPFKTLWAWLWATTPGPCPPYLDIALVGCSYASLNVHAKGSLGLLGRDGAHLGSAVFAGHMAGERAYWKRGAQRECLLPPTQRLLCNTRQRHVADPSVSHWTWLRCPARQRALGLGHRVASRHGPRSP